MCHCYPAPAPAPAPVSNGGQGEKCVHAAFCVTINYTDPHLTSGLLITAVNGNSRKLWKKKHLKNLLRHTTLKSTLHTISGGVTLLTHMFSRVSYIKEKALIMAFFEYCEVSLTAPSAYYLGPHIQPVTLHSAVLHKKNLQKSSLMWLVEPSLHDCTKCLCGINMLTAPGLHS